MKSPLTSDRLQKPLEALRKAGAKGLTPIELNQICNSTRASSDLSELRQWGVSIEKIYEGKSANKRMVYRYRLGAMPTGILVTNATPEELLIRIQPTEKDRQEAIEFINKQKESVL